MSTSSHFFDRRDRLRKKRVFLKIQSVLNIKRFLSSVFTIVKLKGCRFKMYWGLKRHIPPCKILTSYHTDLQDKKLFWLSCFNGQNFARQTLSRWKNREMIHFHESKTAKTANKWSIVNISPNKLSQKSFKIPILFSY